MMKKQTVKGSSKHEIITLMTKSVMLNSFFFIPLLLLCNFCSVGVIQPDRDRFGFHGT